MPRLSQLTISKAGNTVTHMVNGGGAVTTCPDCKGKSDAPETHCTTCKGYGVISREHAWRIDCGNKVRRHRERHNMGLREGAKHYGVSSRFLSRLERGEAPKIVYFTMCRRLGIAVDAIDERKRA